MGAKLAEADHECNTCLLYPVSDFWRLLPGERNAAEKLRTQLYATTRTLFEEHIEFDIIDDPTLLKCDILDGEIKCGEESYKNIIIPYHTCMSDEYLSAIKAFKARGITVTFSDTNGKLDLDAIYCYLYDALEDRYIDMKLDDVEVHFCIKGYCAIMLVYTANKVGLYASRWVHKLY